MECQPRGCEPCSLIICGLAFQDLNPLKTNGWNPNMRVAGSDDFPFQRDHFHFDTVDGRNPAITIWDDAKTRCKQWDKRPSPQLVSRISEPINGMIFPDYYPVILGIVKKVTHLSINIPMKTISIYMVTISNHFFGRCAWCHWRCGAIPIFFPEADLFGCGGWSLANGLMAIGVGNGGPKTPKQGAPFGF